MKHQGRCWPEGGCFACSEDNVLVRPAMSVGVDKSLYDGIVSRQELAICNATAKIARLKAVSDSAVRMDKALRGMQEWAESDPHDNGLPAYGLVLAEYHGAWDAMRKALAAQGGAR